MEMAFCPEGRPVGLKRKENECLDRALAECKEIFVLTTTTGGWIFAVLGVRERSIMQQGWLLRDTPRAAYSLHWSTTFILLLLKITSLRLGRHMWESKRKSLTKGWYLQETYSGPHQSCFQRIRLANSIKACFTTSFESHSPESRVTWGTCTNYPLPFFLGTSCSFERARQKKTLFQVACFNITM